MVSHQSFEGATKVIGNHIIPLLRDDTSVVGTGQDTTGFDEILAIVSVGATDITVDASVWECETVAGTYTKITGADFSQWSATDDGTAKVARIRTQALTDTKPFVQVKITVGDGTNGADTSAVLILCGPDNTSRADGRAAYDITL